MGRGDLLCPIDNLVLDLPIYTEAGIPARDATVGGHMHLSIDQTVTCANGHRWRIRGELVQEREA